MGAGYSMKARGAEADVFIYEDVGAGWFGGVSAKQFAADLKALGAVDTIHVRINSYGGEVFDGVAIYQQLVEHPAKVIVHIDGVAASIASVIAMAGDEIQISQAGFMMIHEASGGLCGFADEHRKMANLLDTITATILDVYVQRTGQEADAIREWMKEEKWFTAQEAVELLMADSIVENLRVAAHADPRRHGFKHLPPSLVNSAVQDGGLVFDIRGQLLSAPPEAPAAPAPEPQAPSRPNPLRARLALQRAQLTHSLSRA